MVIRTFCIPQSDLVCYHITMEDKNEALDADRDKEKVPDDNDQGM